MTRELAARMTPDGAQVTLLWEANEQGDNFTWLVVVNGDNGFSREVDPKLAMHAYTHAGAYIPEAFQS